MMSSKNSFVNGGYGATALEADFDEEEFSVEIRDAPPADLLIKIQSFSQLSKHGIQKHESSVILAGNYKWRLTIYPNGHDCKKEGDNISVYLSVVDTDSLPTGWEVYAKCSILLHNLILDNYFCFQGRGRRFDAMNPKCGFSISKRSFARNGYLVGDTCAFGAEVLIINRHVVECFSLLDWKISDISKFVGSVWSSEEFPAGGLRWKIMLSANGYSVSIYLECVDAMSFAPHQRVKADFCICIRNNLPNADCCKSSSHWFTCMSWGYGFGEFIWMNDILDPTKGFIMDDCCFLRTKIYVQDVTQGPRARLMFD